MKRWLSGLLAALLLVSLAACGGMADPLPPEEESPRPEEELIGLPVEDPEDAEAPEAAGDPAAPEDPSASPAPEAPPAPDAPEDAEASAKDGNAPSDNQSAEAGLLPENGSYTTKDDVALYIHQYGRLPDNFITKKEAQDLGWSGGSLEPYAPGMCIGGSRFGNYEGLLPEAEGRRWTECDIDTLGAKSRGARRIVFSNDGLIYYTGDHYESFERLYGDAGDG